MLVKQIGHLQVVVIISQQIISCMLWMKSLQGCQWLSNMCKDI